MKNILRVFALLSIALLTFQANAEAPFSFAETPGKLPKDVVPINYTVHVVPDLASFTFRGTENIQIEVLRETSKIVLNALNIDIDLAMIGGGGIGAQALSPVLDKEQQTVSFHTAKPLTPGRYALNIAYRGVINRQAQGLYYDKYSTSTGDKMLLGTHMEPTEARRFFPCWDEPAFRAKFKLSVDVPKSFKAFSNTPIIRQEALENGLHRVSFDTTPKMPSYLMVLIAGEMERITGRQDGVEIGIVTTEGKKKSTAYALTISKDILHFFNDYFGVRYPLPKLDQIAIPGGIGGAMENWGGILYNESHLLYNPKKSPDSTKQRIFNITAHEMAHQWFGDLVTMAWWDNLWLNEGFASWMATKTSDHFNPDWQVWLAANSDRERAMDLDARKSTHPVQQPVHNESQANDVFDDITYLKGQAFLRMLETYLGEKPFRKGIRAYMVKHQYSNTTTADLWAALEQASGKPVAEIASDWTAQPGFPVVTVEEICQKGQRKITLSQEQFQLDDAPSANRLWRIPIKIGTVGGKADYVLLDAARRTITRPGCSGTLVLDPDGVGFYRVHYSTPLFNALRTQVKKLPDSARLKFLSDTWALVAAHRVPLSDYMNLLAQLGDEPRLAVWNKIFSDLQTLDSLSVADELRPQLRRFALRLSAPKFKQLGWEEKPGESIEHRQLREKLIFALAGYGDETVIAKGREKFHQFVAEPSSLPASLLAPVMFIAGRYADQADYDVLKGLAEKTQTSDEKFRYYRSLSTALDPKLAEQTLKLALSPDLPPLVISRIVADVAGSASKAIANIAGTEHLDLAWTFAKEHGELLLKSKTLKQRNHFFPTVAGLSASAAHADDLENHVKSHLPVEALAEALRTGEGIRIRAKLKDRLLPVLSVALEEKANR